MADYVIYEDHIGVVLGAPVSLKGGQVISDSQFNIALLLAAGFRMVQLNLVTATLPSGEDPEVMVPPWFQLQDNTSNTGAAYGSTTSYANYFGRCNKAYTSFDARLAVVMAMSGATWGEFAIAKSIKPYPATARDLTVVGYTDVTAIINTTGNKTITIPVSGGQEVEVGDHVWLVFAKLSTGTPAFRSHPVGDAMDMGFLLNGGNVRPSLILGTPTNFNAGQTGTNPIRFAVWPT